jgi:hypothetical protein
MHDTLLKYHNFNKPFHIDTNTSKPQLESIIYQDHSINMCYWYCLTKYQKNYLTLDKELLSIAYKLKTYLATLLGNEIHINTDTLNLLNKNKLSSHLTY